MATPQRILIVSATDVCASPLVAAVLRDAVEGRRPAVRVATAGAEATTGEPACAVAGAPLAETAVATHRSTVLTPALVRSSALVLVMDKEQRAAVNRLVPGRQRSVFTLREAASLALRDGADAWAGTEPLDGFARELHRRRGLVVPGRLAVPRRGVLRRPVAVVGVDDLPDGHGLDDEAHAWALRQADVVASALATALLGRAGASRAVA